MEQASRRIGSGRFLDIERTRMAMERTFLSYIRTSLTVLVAGVTLIQFFDNITFRTIGVVLIPVSIIIFIIGSVRINNKRKKLRALEKELGKIE